MDIHQRLDQLGLTLPSVAPPVASYVPAVNLGTRIIVSGQLPLREGELVAIGAVPSDVSLDQAKEAAARCVLNTLAAIDQALKGDWARFERIARLGVFVNSAPGFADQHQVANGASDLIGQVFDAAGVHVRAAVGVAGLPLNAPVEIELEAELRLRPACPPESTG